MNINDWELDIVMRLNHFGRGVIDAPLRFISSIRFLAAFWTGMVLIALAAHPDIIRHFIAAVLIVSALHFTITEGLIKHLSKKIFPIRKRPYISHPSKIRPIGRKFSDSSFPSSHMATTVGMLFVIVSFYPSLLSVAVLFSIIMAFARLHNGMHYPSDVLVGILLGLAYGFVAMRLIQ